jgi:radical SAM protein with 4Fe4S-binding SPASM domain
MRKLIDNARLALGALATRTIELDCDRLPFRYERLSWTKLLNWISLEASIHARRTRPWGLPTHIQVEPCNVCNLRCSLCPVTDGLGVPSGFMEFELFRDLTDQVCNSVLLMLLWEWGEPFVHPRIYDMIAYASSKGIRVLSSTNGHRFADPVHARSVVDSGLDTLIFALDGISQPTYERYRQGGKLETVLAGIRNVVASKRALGSTTPRINLRFIVMKYNEHEIPLIESEARALGVDVLTLKTLYPGHDCDPAKDGENPFIPENPRYQRFSYSPETGARLRVRDNQCKHLWNAPSVRWDGKMVSCGFDIHQSRILGDLTTSAFRDIWFGEAYQKMRREFRRDWEALPICGRCSYAWQGGNCARETVHDAMNLAG